MIRHTPHTPQTLFFGCAVLGITLSRGERRAADAHTHSFNYQSLLKVCGVCGVCGKRHSRARNAENRPTHLESKVCGRSVGTPSPVCPDPGPLPAKRPRRPRTPTRTRGAGNAAPGRVRRSTITGPNVGPLGAPHRIALVDSWGRFLSDHQPRPTTSPALRLHPGHSTHAPAFSGLTPQRTENRHRLITRGLRKKEGVGVMRTPESARRRALSDDATCLVSERHTNP